MDSQFGGTVRTRARVLVADDHALWRQYLRALLGHEYEIVEAGDSADALKLFATQEVDLVLLAGSLPGMGALHVCRSVKAADRSPTVPVVILLSLDSSQEDRRLWVEAGVDDFLSKPISQSELLARARAFTTLRRQAGTIRALSALNDESRFPGLSLTFTTPLNRIDRFIIDGVIVGVLGRNTSCEIAEFVVRETETLVRLTADSPDQLLAVALVLTDIVGGTDADDQRRQVELWGKRYVADDLRARWRNTAETLKSIELRIEPQKLEAAIARDPAYAVLEGVTALPPDWRETLAPVVDPIAEGLRAAAALEDRGEALQQLLISVFEPGALHGWLRTTFGVALAAAVPGPVATHAGVVAGAIEAWEARGLVTADLFERLARVHPEHAAAIWAVATRWGLSRGSIT